ncbi:MAG: phosphate ABC transporter permease PstA [Oscillospiraceae bacterium]
MEGIKSESNIVQTKGKNLPKDKTFSEVWAEKWKTYKSHPLSFGFFILVSLCALITTCIFIFLVGYVLIKGVPYLKPSLFAPNYTSENVSMLPSIITTLEMVVLALLIAVPFGIGCAVYLVEYAKKGNKIVKAIRLTTQTLSGIPSIVYGLFGMLFFVTYLGWGYSLLAGSFTVAIMILPLIITSTEEALLSVPDSFREGSFGLGAGKLRTIFVIVLPSAMNGIVAGVILAIGRIIGETAALIYTSGTMAQIPKNVFSSGRTLATHMYLLSGEGLHMNEASAVAVVILITVLILNSIASLIAKKLTKG